MCHQSATMHYTLFVTCALFAISSQVSGLSSKLDFGDDSNTSSGKTKSIIVPIKHERVEIIKKDSGNLDNVEVICTTGGCNTTSEKKDTGTVKTDVIVQVKTLVDLENNKKKVEDIPDVPVVVGTNGAGSKNRYPSYSGSTGGLQYQPAARNYGANKPIVVTNIEKVFPSVTSKFIPDHLYRAQTRDGFDIKFRTLPPLVVTMPDGFRYKANGVELKVPYFEPSYHNHYYGEKSPPQVAYYPRKNVHNPVAFTTNVQRPTYSNWNQNYPVATQNHRHDANCMCQNQNSGGLRWYPSSGTANIDNTILHRRNDGKSNDPGRQINDKLAKLN